jgi:hypothetical protein
MLAQFCRDDGRWEGIQALCPKEALNYGFDEVFDALAIIKKITKPYAYQGAVGPTSEITGGCEKIFCANAMI